MKVSGRACAVSREQGQGQNPKSASQEQRGQRKKVQQRKVSGKPAWRKVAQQSSRIGCS